MYSIVKLATPFTKYSSFIFSISRIKYHFHFYVYVVAIIIDILLVAHHRDFNAVLS